MRSRVLFGLGAVVLLAAAALVVRSRTQDDPIGPTASVQRGTIERIVVASGTIEPEHLVEVRSKVSGIVQRFHVEAGDRVTPGQVVAELDRKDPPRLPASPLVEHAEPETWAVPRVLKGGGHIKVVWALGVGPQATLIRNYQVARSLHQ